MTRQDLGLALQEREKDREQTEHFNKEKTHWQQSDVTLLNVCKSDKMRETRVHQIVQWRLVFSSAVS